MSTAERSITACNRAASASATRAETTAPPRRRPSAYTSASSLLTPLCVRAPMTSPVAPPAAAPVRVATSHPAATTGPTPGSPRDRGRSEVLRRRQPPRQRPPQPQPLPPGHRGHRDRGPRSRLFLGSLGSAAKRSSAFPASTLMSPCFTPAASNTCTAARASL